VDAVAASLTPDLAPSWPRYGSENAVWPWLSRAAASFNVILPIAGTIVALRWLDRLTLGWTRRRVLCIVLLVLAEGAIAATRADQWLDIVATGLVGGMVSAGLFAFVLRFDLRVVPALVGTYMAVAPILDAVAKGTPQGWLLGVVGAATTLGIAWIATRYLVARGEIIAEASPAPAPAD
jgi:hypothetical protein